MILARAILPVVVVVALARCAASAYSAAPERAFSLPADAAVHDVFAWLRSQRGPTRFQQVAPALYRGGQPTAAHLAALHALGVRTIVDLRNTPAAVAAERAEADRLGLRFLSFPFSGLGAPDPTQLRAIVAALVDAANGPVYVHCQQGRDRTSLVVALYRVWHDGWSPELAWQREADDYGHGGWRHIFFRKLDRAFVTLTDAG
jgi:protein tyrosine/serine phosphatase